MGYQLGENSSLFSSMHAFTRIEILLQQTWKKMGLTSVLHIFNMLAYEVLPWVRDCLGWEGAF